MILGLDASTSTVGYAFSNSGDVIDASFIDISGIKNNREKATKVIDVLKNHPLADKITTINLEGSLSGFAGPSSRTVVILLARWNAVLEYALQDAFNVNINLVGAMTARKQVFGASRVAGIKPKEFVKMEMNKLYDMTPWIVNNKRGAPDKRNEDIYDAAVISLYNN
jgi:hypothetical protein